MRFIAIPMKNGGYESMARQSDCGEYEIAKYVVCGTAQYVASHKRVEMSTHKTFEEAKGACEWHQQRAQG